MQILTSIASSLGKYPTPTSPGSDEASGESAVSIRDDDNLAILLKGLPAEIGASREGESDEEEDEWVGVLPSPSQHLIYD